MVIFRQKAIYLAGYLENIYLGGRFSEVRFQVEGQVGISGSENDFFGCTG